METSILLDAGLIPAERQRLLLQRIEQDGRIASVQAALDFAVSEDTIRRDLKELADAGLIERVHGGALRKSRASHRFDRRLISNEAQKKHYLPRIANMDDWWCQGFSEPGAGSDLASLKTSAKKSGDSYIVNGQKT